ncbi:MAG: hypothetical protein HY698_18810 [Deltaproteobacteria bacterium]|nr:hypothetical protein [Deltaproteobacteria bacterium]
MRRWVSIFLALVFSAPLSPGVAWAVENAATIKIGELKDGKFTEFTNQTQLDEFFNRANCLCATKQVALEIEATSDLPTDVDDGASVVLWAGTECNKASNEVDRKKTCRKLGIELFTVGELRKAKVTKSVTVGPLVQRPEDEVLDCSGQRDLAVFALIDTGGDATPEHFGQSAKVGYDGDPPTQPSSTTAEAGSSSITVSGSSVATTSDIFIQVLCAKADGTSVFTDNKTDAKYELSEQTCQVKDEKLTLPLSCTKEDAAVSGGTNGDAGVTGVKKLNELDKDFVCSERTQGTTATINLQGLDLDPNEKILIRAIYTDAALNTVASCVSAVQLTPSSGFWGEYQKDGGLAEEGCSLAPPRRARGRSLLGVLALFAVTGVAWLARRRRLKARHIVPFLLAGLAASTTSTARAQVFIEEGYPAAEQARVSTSVFEVKLGPYFPDVDKEDALVRAGKTPYETFFGDDSSLMTQIEYDRFFLWPAGQLGIGLGAGYMQESGDNCKLVGGVSNCSQRVTADETIFHLIPLHLSAVYRFTYLADRRFFPVAPYGKIGLSYYIWLIRDEAAGGDAEGATLGWQWSLGLTLRADDLDPGATRNLRNDFGVEHAGFFAEMTKATVDGLGQERKLSVGDFTWSAGVNFEF